MAAERRHRLTIAFMESRPAAAARVLADLDPGDSGALLARVPARLAASVLAEMPVWVAARCVETMDATHAGAILRALRYQDATSVLRQLAQSARDRVLHELPKSLSADLLRSLSYPRNTVGAWMDHAVPTFASGARASEVLKFARLRRTAPLDHVFVMDSKRRYRGSVSIARVLKADGTALLEDLLDTRPAPVSNRAALHSVDALADWDRFTMLPVVGRTGNVVGGLHRSSLREGLEQEHAAVQLTASAPAMVGHLFTAYLATLSALFRLLLDSGVESAREEPR